MCSLVNNAGAMHDRSLIPSETPIETIRQIFEPNFFGVIAITQGCSPCSAKARRDAS